jgi:hypothetical protein
LPRDGESRSLTTPREKLVKIGASVVRDGRYVVFQVAEVAVARKVVLHNLRPRRGPALAFAAGATHGRFLSAGI